MLEHPKKFMRPAALLLLVMLLSLGSASDGIGGGPDVGGGISPEATAGAGIEIPVYPDISRPIPVPEACAECPPPGLEPPLMLPFLDDVGKDASIYVAATKEGRRVPLEGATVFIHVYKSAGDFVYSCRAYTDSSGGAVFSYAPYEEACKNGCTIKFVFCCSGVVEQSCMLPVCLGSSITSYSDYVSCPGYPDPWPVNATVDGVAYPAAPAVAETQIPPSAEAAAFALDFVFCFPILVLFGLLGAAMYASGRDPFAIFSFYTPRYTRGAERPMGARGFTFDTRTIMGAAQSIAMAGIAGARKAEKQSSQQSSSQQQGGQQGGGGQVQTTQGATGALGEPRQAQQPTQAPSAASVAPQGARAPGGGLSAVDLRAAAPQTGGLPIQLLANAIFKMFTGDMSGWSRFAQLFTSSSIYGQFEGIGAQEFAAQMASTLLIYSNLPFGWLVNSFTYSPHLQTLAGARNLANIGKLSDMLYGWTDEEGHFHRGWQEDVSCNIHISWRQDGEVQERVFARGSNELVTFIQNNVTGSYYSAQQFVQVAMADSQQGLAASSTEAIEGNLRGAEGRMGIVDLTHRLQGFTPEQVQAWTTERGFQGAFSGAVGVLMSGRNADGTETTMQQKIEAFRTAAAAFSVFSGTEGFADRYSSLSATQEFRFLERMMTVTGTAESPGLLREIMAAEGGMNGGVLTSASLIALCMGSTDNATAQAAGSSAMGGLRGIITSGEGR
ncbi:MAG: hypothetical protein PHY95_03180, partial [Candidatus ainarchaeum sp.]|nr:hypothetical protein [Candidatus ainarchaeum sp.]